jgi:chromosome partitioning protein
VDVLLVDAPPWLGPEIKDALLHAHVVLLPVMPGAYDIWVLQETLGLLAEARKTRRDLKAYVVPNAIDHTKASEFMLSSLPKLGVKILGKGLSKRAAHRDVALAGTGVTEFAPSSPAADEMRSLFRAVRTALTAKESRA